MPEQMEGYVTVPEAARQLARSQEQVRRYLREGRLPGRRVGGQWFIPETAIREPVAVYEATKAEEADMSMWYNKPSAAALEERRRLFEDVARIREEIRVRWQAQGIRVDVVQLVRQLREERS